MPFTSIATGIAPSSSPVSDCNRAGNHLWLVAIAEDPARLAILGGNGVPLSQLVTGLNALGVSPRDLIVILQALKASGALQADIEVM